MKKRTRRDKYLDKLIKYFDNGDNIFPKPMTDSEFAELISDYILGEDWYQVNPVSHEQCNVYKAQAIIEKINGNSK